MDTKKPNPGDPTTAGPSAAPLPDARDLTPPHGDAGFRPADNDAVVNEQRNMSRHGTPPPADPDNDRPES